MLFLETSGFKSLTVKIATLNGQLVYAKNIEGSFNQIDLSSFQKGIYFITIRSKDFVTQGR